jgi:hypothetical protein
VALTLATATALVGMATSPAFASPGETSGGSTQANAVVLSSIALTGLTSSFTLTGVPRATVVGSEAVTMNVETNNLAGYVVTVQSESDVLAPSAQANADSIPIDALQVRETGSGSYSSVSDSTPLIVHTQDVRSAEGGDSIANDYRLTIPFVNEDTYSATLDYIATTL